MKIYHYNEEGLFIREGYADPDPLRPGHWLIPAFATTIEPPIPGENQLVRFVNGTWVIEDIPLPPELEQEPEPTPDELKRQQIQALNAEFIPVFEENANAYLKALMDGNQDLITELIAEREDLKLEYNTAILAILAEGEEDEEQEGGGEQGDAV
jgi:hypothetical protein